MGIISKTEGYVTEEDITSANIAATAIFGYEFIGWSHDYESMSSSIIVTPIYKISPSESSACTISVTNGTVNGQSTVTVSFDTRCAIIAEDVDGKKFSHWIDGAGQVVSLDQTHVLYAAGDLSFTAVYVDEAEEITAKLATAIINENPCWSFDGVEYTVALTAITNLPEGAIAIEQGLVIGGKNYNSNPNKLSLSYCDQQGVANHINQSEFLITLAGLDADRYRNVRAYLTYSLNNKFYTVYSGAVVHIETLNGTLTTSTVTVN